MDIFEKARELAEALRDSEAFQTMKQLEERIEADAEALDIMHKITSLEQEIRQAMEQPDADQAAISQKIQAYQGYRKTAQENELLAEYAEAQETFQSAMSQVNQVISFVLTGRDPEEACGEGCCSGDCHGCSGCAH